MLTSVPKSGGDLSTHLCILTLNQIMYFMAGCYSNHDCTKAGVIAEPCISLHQQMHHKTIKRSWVVRIIQYRDAFECVYI